MWFPASNPPPYTENVTYELHLEGGGRTFGHCHMRKWYEDIWDAAASKWLNQPCSYKVTHWKCVSAGPDQKPPSGKITVICTNDYPHEVVIDPDLVPSRRAELQVKFDVAQGYDPKDGLPLSYQSLKPRVYIHHHEVPIYDPERNRKDV